MTRLQVALPPEAWADPAAHVERCYRDLGLVVVSRRSLRSCAGSIHWHIRKEGCKGTVEITVWPAERAGWVDVHANRQSEWTGDGAQAVRQALEASTPSAR